MIDCACFAKHSAVLRRYMSVTYRSANWPWQAPCFFRLLSVFGCTCDVFSYQIKSVQYSFLLFGRGRISAALAIDEQDDCVKIACSWQPSERSSPMEGSGTDGPCIYAIVLEWVADYRFRSQRCQGALATRTGETLFVTTCVITQSLPAYFARIWWGLPSHSF